MARRHQQATAPKNASGQPHRVNDNPKASPQPSHPWLHQGAQPQPSTRDSHGSLQPSGGVEETYLVEDQLLRDLVILHPSPTPSVFYTPPTTRPNSPDHANYEDSEKYFTPCSSPVRGHQPLLTHNPCVKHVISVEPSFIIASPQHEISPESESTFSTELPSQRPKSQLNPTAPSWVPSSQHLRGNLIKTPGYESPFMSGAILTGWPVFPTHEPQHEQKFVPQHGFTSSSSMFPIALTSNYLEDLYSLLHDVNQLRSAGYTLENLTLEGLEGKKRCTQCNKYMTKTKRFEHRRAHMSEHSANPSTHATYTFKSVGFGGFHVANGHPEGEEPPPKNICHFHPGVKDLHFKIWTCCNKNLSEKACQSAPAHVPVVYRPGELEAQWRHYETPPVSETRRGTIRLAVAIDCEMGTTHEGESELIRVTLIDYATGGTLVDNLVLPDVRIVNYNTRYSGVSYAMMLEAKRSKTCFFGRDSAREAVWRFVGPETIVIGHSAYNDLKALRWIHRNLVDTFLLEPKPVEEINFQDNESSEPLGAEQKGNEQMMRGKQAKTPKGSGPRALKTLARVKLGREIQCDSRKGHDSFEDALAARDLVHWEIMNRRYVAAH